MKHSQIMFGLFFSILLLISISAVSLNEAEAQKASGKFNQKYGQDTSSVVCGDRLCSEIKNDFLGMSKQSTFMIGGVAFQSYGQQQSSDDVKAEQIVQKCIVKFEQIKKEKTGGKAIMELKKECEQNINDLKKNPLKNEVIILPDTSIPGCEKTNSCFTPHSITVNVGDVVTWINSDSAAHTVTSGILTDDVPNGEFDSSLFMTGNNFSHKFEAVGTFDYYCLVHPWMQGVVTVIP